METILAIDLGKYKSVFCKLDTSSLKPEYSTVKTASDKVRKMKKYKQEN